MKVLFINIDGLWQYGDDYYTVDPWILFPMRLSKQCEQITLLSAVKISKKTDSSKSPLGWRVDISSNLQIENFDYYNSFVSFYKLLPKRYFAWKKQMESLIDQNDVVVVRLPSPTVALVTRCILRLRKPLVCIVRGNIHLASDRLVQNKGIKRLFFKGLIRLIMLQEKKCSKISKLVYVYSNELFQRFLKSNANVKLMRTAHVSMSDFYHRDDTCQSDEIKLLRICRLVPIKDLECLFESVALLLSQKIKIKLEIVGEAEKPDYLANLKDRVNKLGISDQVQFSGWVPYDQTEEIYVRNDIQVISSINEGTPRSIVEGASRGLPLVSTSAGGCADVLTHEKNALLVSPGDPKLLAAAIKRVITDDSLRKKLIRGGYEFARSSSFEVMGKQFLDEIKVLAQ